MPVVKYTTVAFAPKGKSVKANAATTGVSNFKVGFFINAIGTSVVILWFQGYWPPRVRGAQALTAVAVEVKNALVAMDNRKRQ